MRFPLIRKREVVEDDVELSPAISPLVAAFYDRMTGLGFSPHLTHKVWVASRCLQLNCQQIASMPLRYMGSQQPAWVTNPDPTWYPNGIGDAVFAAVWSMYGWGDAFLYITARYANGLPSAWTVLDPAPVSIEARNGMREYKSSGRPLNRDDVVQISRNPHGNALRGSSVLAAYAPHLWGAISGSELARSFMAEGGVPNSVLKSQRKLTEAQAAALQTQWMERTAARGGGPAVLPPEIDFQTLAFSPQDLMLLDAQEFNARVIASAFGVPAFMLNMPLTSDLTYSTTESLFDYWWRAELRPAAIRISDALSSQMLPRGSSVHFDARETLTPGLVDLHKIWSEALTAGAVSVDEYRRAVLQLGPLGEAGAIEELLQPMSAGASPADQPNSSVVALRPTGVIST